MILLYKLSLFCDIYKKKKKEEEILSIQTSSMLEFSTIVYLVLSREIRVKSINDATLEIKKNFVFNKDHRARETNSSNIILLNLEIIRVT